LGFYKLDLDWVQGKSPSDQMKEFPHETIAEEEYNKTPISKV
jgi:hypothetical protein